MVDDKDSGDRVIRDFLAMHIPEGAIEYAPRGTEESTYLSSGVVEHFNVLAAEERRALERIDNLRFLGKI